MSNSQSTIVGNLTRDPELRFSNAGTPVCSFGVAVNHRRKNQAGDWEDETSFVDVVAFKGLAENTAESLARGDRVIVTGRLRVRPYDRKDGGQGTAVEVVADDIGAGLRWATVTVTRSHRGGGGGSSSAPVYAEDEEPFVRPTHLGDL